MHQVGDEETMARAIALGEQGRRTCAPNPWVGCVLVRDGEIVGEGYHRKAGEPHAEPNALAVAGARARGATAYVTLEPHSHYGRPPPCTDALIAAGVARVVVALIDPDPNVQGRGVQQLRDAGIEVEVGVGAEAAARSLAPYLHHRRTRRAFCVVKAAVSLDGRTAAEDGSSQWITGRAARASAHTMRAESQAVLVGAGTALADRPSLTVRNVPLAPGETQPLRVLLDAQGRVPAAGPLFDVGLAPTLVVTTSQANPARVETWRAAGAEVVEVPASEDGVDLTETLRLLGERGVLQVLVEGGAALSGALANANLIDRLVVYVGAVTLGERGRPLFVGEGPSSIGDARRWHLAEVCHLGDDVRLCYEPIEAMQMHEALASLEMGEPAALSRR